MWRLPAFTFDKERGTCERCAHVQRKGSALDCVAESSAMAADGWSGKSKTVACLTMRHPDGLCGSAARLYLAPPPSR